MKPSPKHPIPRARQRTTREWAEFYRAQNAMWKGHEHTKAYRFRRSFERDMAREFGRAK
jgi:hypothetical protein